LPAHATIPTCLERRFKNVERVGRGAFSEVFSVQDRETNVTFAVKRSLTRHATAQGRLRRLEEVSILKKIGPHEHILELFASWEEESHLYMQTDYCENGSLDVFLQDVGQKSRLDEFRVWKILTELCLGVAYIHDKHFLHLDLKPANILITFEGVLKIGDFGMSCPWPAPVGTEREGDREYIAPEVLSSGIYDKPVDIFSLGLMIFEVAANIVLPDNGASWQKLRKGDISDAPRLSSSDEGQLMQQGEHVMPHRYLGQGGLDAVVTRMLSADPSERPTALELLEVEEVIWVNRVRRAGATIFEGDRGPDAQEGDDDIYAGNGCVAIQEDDDDWQMSM
jgi:mitosis inhibitor protein kinase SWE1